MKAKEKAKELVDRFMNIQDSIGVNSHNLMYLKEAKQCALICVDEKIETLLPYAGLLDIKKQVQELEEVKQEIKEL